MSWTVICWLVIAILQIWLPISNCAGLITGNEEATVKRQKKLSAVIEKTIGLHTDIIKRRTFRSYDAFSSSAEGRVEHRCWGEPGQAYVQRTSCCSPNDVRHIYNAKVEQGRLVLFRKVKQYAADISPQQGKQGERNKLRQTKNTTEPVLEKLPSVTSVRNLNRLPFRLPIEEQSTDLNCSSIFNGTLHIISRSTVKNVYHAIGDNLMPFISEILLDAELEPEFLHLPRMLLTGISGVPPGNIMVEEGTVPHMQLVASLASAGLKNMGDIVSSGMCFRRIVWGHGPHILYLDTLSTLRRKSAEFARHLVREFYDIKFPSELAKVEAAAAAAAASASASSSSAAAATVPPSIDKVVKNDAKNDKKDHHRILRKVERPKAQVFVATSKSKNPKGGARVISPSSSLVEVKYSNIASSTNVTSSTIKPLLPTYIQLPKPYPEMRTHGLRIVVYTRGNSGYGRSIQGEDQLVNTLNSLGHSAVLCCNFQQTSIGEQLSLAVYADVIIGLHGAALAHGVFMRPGTVSIELKTKYGYDSVLFALISESHLGIHAQVDIRHYFRAEGHRPIDRPLIQRVVDVISTATVLAKVQDNTGTERNAVNNAPLTSPSAHRIGTDISSQTDPIIYDYSSFSILTKREELGNTSMIIGLGSSVIVHTKSYHHPGDMLIAFGSRHSVADVKEISTVRTKSSIVPAKREETTDNIFGPFIRNQTDICYGMIMSKVRERLGHKERSSFHCNICTAYNGEGGIRRLLGQEMYEV